MSHHAQSPEIAAIQIATERIVTQLRRQTREQARLIRSGAAGELTEADVERMARDIAAAARAQLDAAVQHCQLPPTDPGLQNFRREADILLAAAARDAGAKLRETWQAPPEKATGPGWGRRWRR